MATKGAGTAFPLLDLAAPVYLVSQVDASKDLQTGVVETTNYRQDFPFIGVASSSTKA